MQTIDPQRKTALLNRLRRIEGQLRGVQVMVSGDQECRAVLQQLAAVRSALNGATQAFAQEYLSACLIESDTTDPASRAALVADLVQVLTKSTISQE